MNKEVSSSILDDAREEIRWILMRLEGGVKTLDEAIDDTLAIEGTTDIECPECEGESRQDDISVCRTCNNLSVIKHEWEMGVHLKNGELPDLAHRALDWILATKDNEPCQIADELESFLKELDDGKRG